MFFFIFQRENLNLKQAQNNAETAMQHMAELRSENEEKAETISKLRTLLISGVRNVFSSQFKSFHVIFVR